MRRSQSWQATTLLLLLLTFGAFACKHTPAPPPLTPAIIPTTTNITPPCGAAPVITLRADSGTVLRGAAISLTWTASNAATVDIQPGIGSVTPVAGGNRQVSPGSSVTYTATATGPCGTAADTLRVTVNEPPAPPPPAVPDPPRTVPTNTGNILTSQQIFDRDMQPINFDYDKSDIRDDQKGKLQKAAEYLKANPSVKVTIEGHTDERGSEEYNLALGDRRANSVRQNLISQGIAESRLGSVSYGEERPMCNEQNEDCYMKNRRAAYKMNQ